MITASNIIPLFAIIPLGGAFFIAILGHKIKSLSDFIVILVTTFIFVLSFLAVSVANQFGHLVYSVGAWKPPMGILMVLDSLTAFMLVTVNLVSFAISVYAIDYMKNYTSKWKFNVLFLIMLAGMNGVIITGDIFNLYVYLEIASIASYALVAFGTEKQQLEAAFKYAIMTTVGSLFILLGIALLYSYTSTLNMADMAQMLATQGKGNIVLMITVLFLMGFGLKTALVPFHGWLPDAHPAAPAPISAMLSGVIIKSLGVYALTRIFFNVIGITPLLSSALMFLAALSMIVGIFLAIGQTDLKRLLAYSSISQIGYVILGIGLGTPLGILGGLFHLFNHSIMKSLLFLNAGAVEHATGTRDLKNLGGLMSRMPVTGVTTTIASLAISGVPPFNGFWSKLIIIIAAVQAGKVGYAFIAVLTSVFTLSAFMRVLKNTFWGDVKPDLGHIKEVPRFMQLSMAFLAFVCVLVGIMFYFTLNVKYNFINQASMVILNGIQYSKIILTNI